MSEWTVEKRGKWTFRVRPSRSGGYLAQAVKGKFASEDVISAGNRDLWFNYGRTADEAMQKVAAEVLS